MGKPQSIPEQEKAIVEMVMALVRDAEEVTRPDRDRWKVALDLFKGKQDFGPMREDNPALSKVFLHEISKINREMASILQDIIFEDPNFFDLTAPEGEEEDQFVRVVEKICRYRISQLDLETFTYDYCLCGGVFGVAIAKLFPVRKKTATAEMAISRIEKQEEKEFKKLGKGIERPEVVLPDDPAALESGIISAIDSMFGSPDVDYTPPEFKAKEKLEYCLNLQLVNPDNYFWEPDARDINNPGWEAERNWVKLFLLDPFFKTGVLDSSKRDALRETVGARATNSTQSSYEEQNLRVREQYSKGTRYTPNVEIIEYFGPWLSPEGEVLEENCWFVVGNGSVLLKRGTFNQWKRRSPLFKSVFSKVPFKAIGAGVTDNAVDNQILINQIMSLYLDHLMFTILGVKGANEDDLVDKSKVEGGFYPGQVVMLQGSKAAKDVFTDLDYNPNLAFPVMQTVEKLSLSAQAAASVDVTSANPTSRARISAAEIQNNSDRSARSQFSTARELDSTYITELINRVLALVLQFDFEREQLVELKDTGVITETEANMLLGLSKPSRFKEVNRNYKIKVKGFRERLERNDFLSRFVEAIAQVNQLQAQDKIDHGELVEVLFEAFRLPTERLVFKSTPQDKAREEGSLLKDRNIEVIPDDDHASELVVHYEQLIRNPTPQAIAHVKQHIMFIQQSGVEPPPMPDEVKDILGFNQEDEDVDTGNGIPQPQLPPGIMQ